MECHIGDRVASKWQLVSNPLPDIFNQISYWMEANNFEFNADKGNNQNENPVKLGTLPQPLLIMSTRERERVRERFII